MIGAGRRQGPIGHRNHDTRVPGQSIADMARGETLAVGGQRAYENAQRLNSEGVLALVARESLALRPGLLPVPKQVKETPKRH